MPTYAVKPGVTLTDGMRAYLTLLQSRLDFQVTVTSGERDTASQAGAMLRKYQQKGEAELRKVYRRQQSLVDALMAAEKTKEAWAQVLATAGKSVSRHLFGGAIDLRTNKLTAVQVRDLKAAVALTGGRAYPEYDHLHVDLPAKYAGFSFIEKSAKSASKVWLVTTAVGLVVIGGILVRRHSRPALPVARTSVAA